VSGTVLPFRAKPVKGLVQRAIPSNAERFYCMECNSDVFKLLADGAVYCAGPSCGQFIANIKVTK
jgi:hypothetical protein